jgi:hypothetical protein
MVESLPPFNERRRLIERRYRRRLIFTFHLLGFIVLCITPVPIWWRTGADVLVMRTYAIWFIVLLMHYLYFRLMAARDQAVEAAWRTFNNPSHQYDPFTVVEDKRKRLVQLSDDGELIEVEDEPDYEVPILRKRGER